MSDSVPPINKRRRNRSWLVAFTVSLTVHSGIGLFLLLFPSKLHSLSTNPALMRPYTPQTYAHKLTTAREKLQKLQQVAATMESLHKKAQEKFEKETGQKVPPPEADPASPPPSLQPDSPKPEAPRPENNRLPNASATPKLMPNPAKVVNGKPTKDTPAAPDKPKDMPVDKPSLMKELPQPAPGNHTTGDKQAVNKQVGDKPAVDSSPKATSAKSGEPVETGKPDLKTTLTTAEETETRITRSYKAIATLERATNAHISVEQARQQVGDVPPASNVPEPEEVAGLKAGKKAPASSVRAAEQRMDAMVSRAQRLLDQAQAKQGTAAGAFRERMVTLAQQDQGGKQADMTGYKAENKKENTPKRPALPGDPSYLLPPPPPALPSDAIKAIPGRRITGADAPTGEWMYVDTWYCLGPFPNPARANLETAYPPETAVDLDATYTGKDGRSLKWTFCQFSSAEMVPPIAEEYAIYYLSTELYFDRPRDAWIAIGSDDQSTLWLNNQLVWKSSSQLKGWQIGEGLRRVHFNAGRNAVLLRVENGWRGVAASLVVSLK